MIVLAMARSSATRITRDRTAIFFLFLLPVMIVFVIGTSTSGFDELDVGVVDDGAGPLGAQLVEALEANEALEVTTYETVDGMRTDLRRGIIDTGVVLPAGMDATLRAGGDVPLIVFADQVNTAQLAAFSAVNGVVADQASVLQAASFATAQVGGTFEANVAVVDTVSGTTRPFRASTDVVDSSSDFLPEGFSYSAPTMLVLFVFINAVAQGAALIATRDLGIYERMLAGPVTTKAIVVGETLAYLGVAVLQSAIILAVGAAVFGVDWGDPLGAAALVGVWALVGTGAGVLAGTLFRTPEQATSIGPPVGIAFAMLGGCMWPLEIVPGFMQAIGHLVPHAWAVDGWITLLSRDGTLLDIGTELLVLAGFALALLAVATSRLRVRLVA